MKHSRAGADVTTGYDLEAARANLPVLREWTYLNTGTVGVMAEPVLHKHLDYIADHERFGHATQARAIEGYERARTSLAALMNARPADIAMNRNATDGINWVAATFPLRDGDEVITSTEEHPAMIFPWLAAYERSGARLRLIDLTSDPAELRSALERAVGPSTRVVALSQVSCETGKRVPVEVVRDVVGDDVMILVDASQSLGQFPINIPSLRAWPARREPASPGSIRRPSISSRPPTSAMGLSSHAGTAPITRLTQLHGCVMVAMRLASSTAPERGTCTKPWPTRSSIRPDSAGTPSSTTSTGCRRWPRQSWKRFLVSI
jgi:hypothetical protein